MQHPRPALFACAVLLASLLNGCASYQLQGVVVEGSLPGIYIVDSGDPRLAGTAVADARVQGMLDPNKIRSKPLPLVMTDDNGRFAIPIEDPGAGLLEYTFTLYPDADGYGTPPGAGTAMALPPPGKQVLVVLAAGRRTGPPRSPGQSNEDLIGEAEKFKKQFE